MIINKCQFCTRDGVVEQRGKHDFYVTCNNEDCPCGYDFGSHYNKKDAVEEWNKIIAKKDKIEILEEFAKCI